MGAAALDVTDLEPLPVESPLWRMSNVLITPHISGLYQDYLNDVFNICITNLKQFKQNGTLAKNQVNLSAGY